MVTTRNLTIAIALALLLSTPLYAGNIDQATAPTAGGRMYTLEQIYAKLHNGTAAVKHPDGSFTEPLVGPASTMYTLDQVYGDFNTDATACNGTVAANVLAGKTFFATSGTTRGTNWGPVAGAMTDRTGTDVASTAQAQAGGINYFTAAAGYYDGTARVSATDAQVAALDGDIIVGNIKSGVSIFGVLGTLASGGLPRTGQTTVYQAGDDGTYQKGVPTAPGAQFTASVVGSDHIATDNGTGLVWAAYDTEAGCNNGSAATWSAAITYCEGLTFAGQSDWRLPNIKELVSIVKYGTFSPAIDTAIFPTAKSSRYWSSTTLASYPGVAWSVNFSVGFVSSFNKANTYYVRAVRGGQ